MSFFYKRIVKKNANCWFRIMVLSSFFSKSKPINFILVSMYMVLFFAMANYNDPKQISLWSVMESLGALVAYILSMLGMNFIAKRNELCGNNSYAIFSFAVCTAMLPETLVSIKILGANFFILLAFRRIVSLRSQKNIQKKIIDASLWITLASLCYFWSILFFIVLFLGIAYYAFQNYRNWLLPFLGIGSVYVLATCVQLFWNDTFIVFTAYAAPIAIYVTEDSFSGQWLPFFSIFAVTLFFLASYLLKYKRTQSKTKPTIILILAMLAVAILILVVAPQKEVSVLFFATTSLTVMIISYLESQSTSHWKEVLLWIMLVLPIILAVF